MALRLTGTATPDSPAPDASAAPLAAAARARLETGGADAYHELAARAFAIEDPQQRYAEIVALVEAGLLAVDAQATGRRARTLCAVAEVALAALEREPAEPILLNYAGVACYELWILDAAQALFAAARRLDPALPHLEGNLAQVAVRRRGPRPVHVGNASAVSLARRGADVARRARPASAMTISLCMIVRDEEEMLGRCLASVAPGVDEIVVVDTGSRDATVQVAELFGARVIEFPWTGSFAEARNVSLEAATGDWILFLDADEVLAAGDAPRLRACAGHTWREGLFLSETSFTGELGDGTAINHLALRMFRNRPEYRFTGRIHEQIAAALPTSVPGRVGTSALRLEHYGYLGDVKRGREKSARNLELLRRQEAELGASAFLHYNLGTEYGAIGDFGGAASHLSSAWSMLEREGTLGTIEYAPLVASGLVRALRAIGRLDDADRRARTGLELYPDFTDLVFEQASTALTRGDVGQARALYERCLTMGDAPARHGGQSGAGSHFAQSALASIALEHDGDPERALELLRAGMDAHPSFMAAAGPFVVAGLRTGVDAASLISELERRLGGLTEAVRHALAGALRREGFAADARRQYEELLAHHPSAGLAATARAALAELLLVAGDLDGAAAQAALVPDDSARAELACRIQTCALLATGDHAGAQRALARATVVGLPTGESEMFAAWLALAAGEAPAGLGIGSIPLLVTLLEMMLGAGALDAFGQLRTLLCSSRLPEREQRQALAEAQLRHGQLAGAASEWMAVCAEAPDAAALLGLAQVAVRHDMPADALVFAAGALELDPACEPARRLTEALAPAVADTVDR